MDDSDNDGLRSECLMTDGAIFPDSNIGLNRISTIFYLGLHKFGLY
jgi:hypothetical protein